MVRSYKQKQQGRAYGATSEATMQAALADIRGGMSIRQASFSHGINFSTLYYRSKLKDGPPGHPTVLSKEEEDRVVRHLVLLSKWGYPLRPTDLRTFIQDYLNGRSQVVSAFKDNLPGVDWVKGFMERHSAALSTRQAGNISSKRAALSPDAIRKFCSNLEPLLDGLPPSNVFNYDESNLVDDPGRQKVIADKKMKRVERVADSSKTATSLMVCGAADGTMLPWYVVHKALWLYDGWCKEAPSGEPFCQGRCCRNGVRVNRSAKGWFDSSTFADWFRTCFLPHASRLQGKKVLIGDNLASHFNDEVLTLCLEREVEFVCLPPNSTNALQPLDVAYFGPMKKQWRRVLFEYKSSKRLKGPVPKDSFLEVLGQLAKAMARTSQQNLISGFRACGIVPLDPEIPIQRLPEVDNEQVNVVGDTGDGDQLLQGQPIAPEDNESDPVGEDVGGPMEVLEEHTEGVAAASIDGGEVAATEDGWPQESNSQTFRRVVTAQLKQMRYGPSRPKLKKKNRRLAISPGKSVCAAAAGKFVVDGPSTSTAPDDDSNEEESTDDENVLASFLSTQQQ